MHRPQLQVFLAHFFICPMRLRYLFMFHIKGSDLPFTRRTQTTQMSGKQATCFMVESVDGATTVTLPMLIDGNNIPTNRAEIPTPEAASHRSHLKPIAHCCTIIGF